MSLLKKLLGMKEEETKQRESVREEVKEQQKQKLQKLVDDVHKAAQAPQKQEVLFTGRGKRKIKPEHKYGFMTKEEFEKHQQNVIEDHEKEKGREFYF